MLKDFIKFKGKHTAKRKLHVKPRFFVICSGVLIIGLVLIIILSSLSAERALLAQGPASTPNPLATVSAPEASGYSLPTETLSAVPTPEPTPIQLKEGVKAEEVIRLQERLMELGYMEQDMSTDYFGPVTEYSLELFQRKHGLQIDGILGEETKQLLFSDQAKKYTVSIGFSGTDVREIQIRLKELDYIQKVTDYFGDETEAAVKEFQSKNNLTVDGSVGSQTKEVLFSNEAKAFYFSIGTSGEEILKLQKRLFELGYLTTEPDGVYGQDTENAIRRFQQKNGFIDDGYAGLETRTMLFSGDAERNALGMGDSGIDVKNIQQRLIKLNYLKGSADGYFGSNTAGAVKAFQKRNGLSVDGKVGAQTLSVLLSDSAKKAATSSGGSSSGDSKGSREEAVNALIEVAKSKLGAKYVLGAKGPNTFDCSGFVYWCLNQIGVKQGYLTSAGWAATSKYPKIDNIKDLKAGDIISFKGHVGIALGGGKMIDCAPSDGGVRIGNLSHPYWQTNFIRGYRVL